MNGRLGRDRVWNDQIWGEIDKAVREEVGRARVAQKVFPATVVNNVLPVSANRAVPISPGAKRGERVPPAPGIDEFQPFFEISRDFLLTQAQVEGEESLHLASSLARLAASALANAEDTILFLGRHSILALAATAEIHVTNQHAVPPGFVAEANNFEPVSVPRVKGLPVGEILTAIPKGMANLNTDGQPGPYALFLSPDRYAQTFAPVKPGTLRTPGDQFKEIVTGGFYMVNTMALASVHLANLVKAYSEELDIEELHKSCIEELEKARNEELEKARNQERKEARNQEGKKAGEEQDNVRIEEVQKARVELENARAELYKLLRSEKLPDPARGVAGPPLPNPDIGILVSLGGEPAKIILGTEATTAFTRIDEKGNYHFRVFERIQMVVRDGRAFQTLEWKK